MCLWIDKFVDKIIRKHNVYPEEVEEMFSKNPSIRRLEGGNVKGEDLVSYSNSVVKLKNLNLKKIKHCNINKIFFEQINLPRNLNRIQDLFVLFGRTNMMLPIVKTKKEQN